MRASPPHHRSFCFCSFSLCESTAKIPLGLALRRAGVRFIPGNRYPGMWSASIQCRVGMIAKLVGKTLKKIDSKIGAANRELKAGAADDERARLLADECAGLVALAAQVVHHARVVPWARRGERHRRRASHSASRLLFGAAMEARGRKGENEKGRRPHANVTTASAALTVATSSQ